MSQPRAAHDGLIRGAGGSSEFLDGGIGENADAVRLSHAEQHVGILGEIVGGSKKTGIAGDAAHIAGGRIVYHAAKRLACLVIDFGGCDARDQRRRRQKAGVVHLERRVNLSVREVGDGLARDAMHDFGEKNIVDVAIDEARAGRRDGHCRSMLSRRR